MNPYNFTDFADGQDIQVNKANYKVELRFSEQYLQRIRPQLTDSELLSKYFKDDKIKFRSNISVGLRIELYNELSIITGKKKLQPEKKFKKNSLQRLLDYLEELK